MVKFIDEHVPRWLSEMLRPLWHRLGYHSPTCRDRIDIHPEIGRWG